MVSARRRAVLPTAGGGPGLLEHRHGRIVPDGTFARLFLRPLAEAGLPAPESEHVVVVDGVRYRLDAAYVERRVGIELDGKQSHLTDVAFEADRVRDNGLGLAGWVILRYTWRRFTTEPDQVVGEVRTALARCGGSGPRRSAD